VAPTVLKGQSVRKLIGQAKLRHVQSSALEELLTMNNRKAAQGAKWQYLFLASGKNVDPRWVDGMNKLPVAKLTDLQRLNLQMNQQLVEAAEILTKKEGVTVDEPDAEDLFA
jgi:hypothetical protein